MDPWHRKNKLQVVDMKYLNTVKGTKECEGIILTRSYKRKAA